MVHAITNSSEDMVDTRDKILQKKNLSVRGLWTSFLWQSVVGLLTKTVSGRVVSFLQIFLFFIFNSNVKKKAAKRADRLSIFKDCTAVSPNLSPHKSRHCCLKG